MDVKAELAINIFQLLLDGEREFGADCILILLFLWRVPSPKCVRDKNLIYAFDPTRLPEDSKSIPIVKFQKFQTGLKRSSFYGVYNT